MNSVQNNLVSIVVATYNGAKYLQCQLDSILQQTYSPIEIIITDDASTDDTVSILKQYAAAHDNITLILHNNNLGYIKNFERGMLAAKGIYISPCDQDDYWQPNKVELMVQQIQNYPMLCADSELVDENLQPIGKKISTLKNVQTYTNCLVFYTDNYVAGHATLFTNELLKKAIPFNTNIPFDWWLAYIAATTGGVKYLDKALVKYRNHSNNIIGAVKIKNSNKAKESKQHQKQQTTNINKVRLQLFYELCPATLKKEKAIMQKIITASSSFSFVNNCKRVVVYLQNMQLLLAIKKKNVLRKLFYCFKMFYQVR